MKKFFGVFLVAICCLAMATPAQAQLLKWGLKGGVNMSKIDWDGGVKGNKDNSAGFFIGPMAEFTIPLIGLGIDGALMYSQRGDEYKQQGIEIPVNLKYTIGLGSMFGIYVAAGPDFFFNFKDAAKSELYDAEDSQVGLNIGAGVKLIQHLQIGINYQIPLGDSFSFKKVGEAIGDGRTKTWQISLAYLF